MCIFYCFKGGFDFFFFPHCSYGYPIGLFHASMASWYSLWFHTIFFCPKYVMFFGTVLKERAEPWNMEVTYDIFGIKWKLFPFSDTFTRPSCHSSKSYRHNLFVLRLRFSQENFYFAILVILCVKETWIYNKHCEILVSCSDKERNCMQAHVNAGKLM